MPRSATAFAPATVANVGPGFDALGLSIQGLGDHVTAHPAPQPGIHLHITGDDGRLPTEATRNCAGIAAYETLRAAGHPNLGLHLELHKGMPIGSGLGSSAASAAAAAVAVNALLGQPLSREALIGPCLEAEAAVAGRHADNVAPALLGGLVLLRSTDPLDVIRLPTPPDLTVVVATPAFELSTRLAREALPAAVPLADHVHNAAHLAAFVAACYTGDAALLGRALSDRVATPVRAQLIPGAAQVISHAQAAGALGASISGAGPSVFALCPNTATAHAVKTAMLAAFADAGLAATAITSPLDSPGATLR